jgi:hypothetical protein
VVFVFLINTTANKLFKRDKVQLASSTSLKLIPQFLTR